ncbi:MAG: TIGR02186 family protein [Kastovskya adunca ATA6-11-RM4]|jgi:hypothetical protein|nr:TIGR02186 family protein [Kastovskya adunca ATA6-11-RM4]
MASEDTDLKKHSAAKVVYRFLGGAALGTFMVLIPYLLSSTELNLLNIGIAALLVVSCGLLSSLLGKRFIEALIRSLESSGLY